MAASKNLSDNAQVDEGALNAGLFTYPVLMAADILAYKYGANLACTSLMLTSLQRHARAGGRRPNAASRTGARPRRAVQQHILTCIHNARYHQKSAPYINHLIALTKARSVVQTRPLPTRPYVQDV